MHCESKFYFDLKSSNKYIENVIELYIELEGRQKENLPLNLCYKKL